MPTVELVLPHHRYEIVIEPGLIKRLGSLVHAVAPHEKAALIVDTNVEEAHGKPAARSLVEAGYDAQVHVAHFSEKLKNMGTVTGLLDALLEARLERKSPVISLGGGICGDTTGFVAASLLRGVPFVQTPTTLLAMVDASVGGKVGVNTRHGKNLIGAFHQPRLVAIDTETLNTLPPRELKCGLAECVKHGVIRDPDLFAWTREHVEQILALDQPTLVELVRRNVAIKASVVQEDEKEAGVRAHLNFGHTFAHAIEATARSGDYPHGEAVSLGMVAATGLAMDTGRCDKSVMRDLLDLLEAIGLPTHSKDLPPVSKLVEAMRSDKKVSGGTIRLVLPTAMGEVDVFDDVPEEAIAAAWAGIRG